MKQFDKKRMPYKGTPNAVILIILKHEIIKWQKLELGRSLYLLRILKNIC